MDPQLLAFQKLAQLFESHGYQLYLVGGTVRDYLLIALASVRFHEKECWTL